MEDSRMARYCCEYLRHCLYAHHRLLQLLACCNAHHRCDNELQRRRARLRHHSLRVFLQNPGAQDVSWTAD